ncbi:MAG: 2-phospho-L-lactate guanylyltransferase [Candidatus Heimdallarchaeota archaeon LC_3]|nr:MAG: 2-phospho-L-lactate guanylyltransferase [Candidatus Heimdallarchaeota archaeon LC_3]
MNRNHNLVISMDILTLIPIKSFTSGKSRLRNSLPNQNETINDIILEMFLKVVTCVKIQSDFGVISPEKKILEMAENLGAKYTFQDKADNLNNSLKSAIDSIWNKKNATNWNSILILMADLPLMADNQFKYFLDAIEDFKVGLLPANLEPNNYTGTSGLFMKKEIWSKIKLEFGKNSFHKFSSQLKSVSDPLYIHESMLGYDLDSKKDLLFLRKKFPNLLSSLKIDLTTNLDLIQ